MDRWSSTGQIGGSLVKWRRQVLHVHEEEFCLIPMGGQVRENGGRREKMVRVRVNGERMVKGERQWQRRVWSGVRRVGGERVAAAGCRNGWLRECEGLLERGSMIAGARENDCWSEREMAASFSLPS